LEIGGDYYWGDYNYTSIDVVKEFGRKYATTIILKNYLEFKNGVYLKTGIAVNNLWHKGICRLFFFSEFRLLPVWQEVFDSRAKVKVLKNAVGKTSCIF